MRMRTIRRRMRCALLPEKALRELHQAMRGTPDDATEFGAARSDAWAAAVRYVTRKYPPSQLTLSEITSAPKGIVVDDATRWISDPDRAVQALAGVLTAIAHVYGSDALALLNECGVRHVEVGLGPIDFALAVLGGSGRERSWSN